MNYEAQLCVCHDHIRIVYCDHGSTQVSRSQLPVTKQCNLDVMALWMGGSGVGSVASRPSVILNVAYADQRCLVDQGLRCFRRFSNTITIPFQINIIQ